MFVLRAFRPDNRPLHCERWQFSLLPIRIGRHPLNDFSLQDSTISAFHARLEDVEGRLCIRDLGSKNGIFVEGLAGKPVRVDANANVDLAPLGFRFYLGPILVELEFTEQEAPLRGSARNGTVLGNPAIISPPGANSSPIEARLAQPAGWAGSAGIAQGSVPAAGTPMRSSDPGALSNRALPGMFAPLPPSAQRSVGPDAPAGAGGAGPPGSPPLRPPGEWGQPLPPDAFAPVPDVPMGGGPGTYRTGFASPDEPPCSRVLDMELDSLALQGLRELAASLVPGRPLETTGDIARLITKLHDAMDVFCRCFVPLRQGYEEFVSSLDLQRAAAQRSRNRSRAALSLETATSPEAVSAALLDPKDHSFDAPKAVEGILADLMLHQVALLDAMMQGVRALLNELSPESIEAALAQGGSAGLFANKYHARWKGFCQRFEQLSEERQAFAVIFGPQFAEVYRRYWYRKNAEGPGSSAPPQGR